MRLSLISEFRAKKFHTPTERCFASTHYAHRGGKSVRQNPTVTLGRFLALAMIVGKCLTAVRNTAPVQTRNLRQPPLLPELDDPEMLRVREELGGRNETHHKHRHTTHHIARPLRCRNHTTAARMQTPPSSMRDTTPPPRPRTASMRRAHVFA